MYQSNKVLNSLSLGKGFRLNIYHENSKGIVIGMLFFSLFSDITSLYGALNAEIIFLVNIINLFYKMY